MGIDTGTATGKLMLTLLGGVAEFERSIMLERQREGIAKARLPANTRAGSLLLWPRVTMF